ncbi:MAG: hypothetical protein RR337_06340 [Clostridia bacterium]
MSDPIVSVIIQCAMVVQPLLKREGMASEAASRNRRGGAQRLAGRSEVWQGHHNRQPKPNRVAYSIGSALLIRKYIATHKEKIEGGNHHA